MIAARLPFFYFSGYHLHLHSFPTRRSSDLVYKAHQENLDREVAVKVLPPWFAADRNFVERFNQEARLDRKSTRLNSSHEWISYAVFCLKKKIPCLCL